MFISALVSIKVNKRTIEAGRAPCQAMETVDTTGGKTRLAPQAGGRDPGVPEQLYVESCSGGHCGRAHPQISSAREPELLWLP